jgi:hypothetical protein
MDTKYNGWKNRQTWNVALWLSNDEPLYRSMVEYANGSKRPTYRGLIEYAGLYGRTPDNIAWNGSRLDYRALSEMVRENRSV